jgi:citronellyl-CoA dehydrogenase
MEVTAPRLFQRRAYRDGRLGSIGGGADEVMLAIICKYMGILPSQHIKK